MQMRLSGWGKSCLSVPVTACCCVRESRAGLSPGPVVATSRLSCAGDGGGPARCGWWPGHGRAAAGPPLRIRPRPEPGGSGRWPPRRRGRPVHPGPGRAARAGASRWRRGPGPGPGRRPGCRAARAWPGRPGGLGYLRVGLPGGHDQVRRERPGQVDALAGPAPDQIRVPVDMVVEPGLDVADAPLVERQRAGGEIAVVLAQQGNQLPGLQQRGGHPAPGRRVG
jgi:hypothetical protein